MASNSVSAPLQLLNAFGLAGIQEIARAEIGLVAFPENEIVPRHKKVKGPEL